MANGQTLDPHAKVSDGQMKCSVSQETDELRGEVKHRNSVSKCELIRVKYPPQLLLRR